MVHFFKIWNILLSLLRIIFTHSLYNFATKTLQTWLSMSDAIISDKYTKKYNLILKIDQSIIIYYYTNNRTLVWN